MNYQIIDKLKSIQEILDTSSKQKWMTLKEVSKYSSLSCSSLHRYILSGALKVSKKTGKLLFKREWVDRFLGE